MEAAGRLDAVWQEERRRRGELKLISKRELRSLNSWMRNNPELVKESTNFLFVHPDDAARLGLADGIAELFGQAVGIGQVRRQANGVFVALAQQFNRDRRQQRLVGLRVNLRFQLFAGPANDAPDEWIVVANEVGEFTAKSLMIRSR